LSRASNNRDGRAGIAEHGDKLGVTYSDMDAAIVSEQTSSHNAHAMVASGSGATDQTPHHVVYRKVT